MFPAGAARRASVALVGDLRGVGADESGVAHQNFAVGFAVQIGRDIDDDVEKSQHDIGIARAVNANLVESRTRDYLEIERIDHDAQIPCFVGAQRGRKFALRDAAQRSAEPVECRSAP